MIAAGASLTAQADNTQVVTIGGVETTHHVTYITFNDDENLTLVYTDGTTETVDMELVTIAFTFIDAVKALDTAADKNAAVTFFDATGRQLKAAPKQGTYIMKKGNQVVKLIKK